MDVQEANFQSEVLSAEMPVFVDFWAPWCGPCKMTGPIVEELEKEYAGKVKVVKVNVDDNQNLAGQYNVLSIPTFMMFKGGSNVDQVIGGVPKQMLVDMIEKHL